VGNVVAMFVVDNWHFLHHFRANEVKEVNCANPVALRGTLCHTLSLLRTNSLSFNCELFDMERTLIHRETCFITVVHFTNASLTNLGSKSEDRFIQS